MGLQGEGESLIRSRAVTHWTLGLIQSARAPLGHHYQTLSPGLNGAVIPCKGPTKKIATHTRFLSSLCFLFARSCAAIWRRTVSPQSGLVCTHRLEKMRAGAFGRGGTDATLMSCCYGAQAKAVA